MTNLNEKTVAELREIAKEMKLSKYSKLRKAEIISLIEENTPKPVEDNFVEKQTKIFLNRHQRRRKEKLDRIRSNKKGINHVYW